MHANNVYYDLLLYVYVKLFALEFNLGSHSGRIKICMSLLVAISSML